jgi:hypothetical protein
LDQCSIEMKWLISRNNFKTKTGSYRGFSVHYVQEVLEQFPYHKDKNPMEETRQPQDILGITGTEDLAKTGPYGLPFQAHKTFHLSQYARIKDAPEDMGKISSHEQVQKQMTCLKEAKGNSQYSGYINAPETMVKFGQMSPPSQDLAISLINQDARTQDAPEAMGKVSSHAQMQEQMPFPKEEKGNYQDSGYSTTPEDMVKFGQTRTPSPDLAISLFTQYAKTQDAPEAMVELYSHEQGQEQMNLPKEAHGISQESRYNTAPDAMVKFGQTSPPSQSLATNPFSKDAITQDAPKAMPKSKGRTSMAEPLWTTLQNKVAKVGDHESNTMQDSNTFMQQEGWTHENVCDTSDSQLNEYRANNLLLPPMAEPLQRPYTPVKFSEPMEEDPATPKTGHVIQPLVKNYVPPQVTQLSTFERSRLNQSDPFSTFNPKKFHCSFSIAKSNKLSWHIWLSGLV